MAVTGWTPLGHSGYWGVFLTPSPQLCADTDSSSQDAQGVQWGIGTHKIACPKVEVIDKMGHKEYWR